MLQICAIISPLPLLQSSCYKPYVYSRNLCYTPITQKPSPNRSVKVTCENWGNQITKLNLARQRALLGHCIVPSVTNSPQVIRIIILLRSTAPPNLMLLLNVLFVIKSFHAFTLYVNIENTQHGFPIKTANLERGDILNEVNIANFES